MEMNEIGIEQHAVLIGMLAKAFCERYGDETGRELMKDILTRYGQERGLRMRSNMISEGMTPDMTSFFIAGEWRGKPGENASNASYLDHESVSTVTKCAWYDAWKTHDLLSYGTIYCHCIDDAICRGFDGGFQLDVQKAIGKGDDTCRFVWNGCTDEKLLKEKRETYGERFILPFSFHCRELIAVTGQYLKEKGYDASLLSSVSDELCELYGENMRNLFDETGIAL